MLKYSRFLFLAHPICVCVCVCVCAGACVCYPCGTNISSGYDVMFHLNIFKAKIPSLLIRFIMTFDGKIQD